MKTYPSIPEYISTFPAPTQKILKKIQITIKKVVPKAVEKISYGMPTYFQNENLVHFAAYKTHIGFYPTPSAIEKFKKELSPYSTSKGSVRFPVDKKLIPYALIEKIVKFRLKETLTRKV
ncbi:DUF1801 domain-containing protein [Candidatus Parcubacteria bacterium]|nr:DUF1801 domain-containing protein [Candidatus Parcubacteria bacterium]